MLGHRVHTHSTTPGSIGSGRDRLSGRVMVSTFGSLAASPLPRATVGHGGEGSRSRWASGGGRPGVIRAVRRRIPAVFATEAPLGLLVRARRSPSVHRLERRPRDRPHCRSTGLAPVGVRRDRDHVLENPARRRTHRRRDRARPRSGPQRPQRGRRHRQLRTDRPRRRRRRTVAGDDQATHLPSTTRAGRSRAPPVPGRRVRRRDGAADHAPLERSGQGARRDPSGLAAVR